MFDVEYYKTENDNIPIKDFLSSLAKKHKEKDIAQIKLFVENLRRYGPEINNKFKPKATRHLGDGIYELRPSNNRVLYFYYDDNNKYVLLHGFTKKTQKTPNKEMNQAKKEKKDYLRRYSK